MYIDNLILEVTRFCNMNCKHCLRGEKQRKKFNTSMLENIFTNIDYIGVITFTGGEPLTQVNTIIETLDYIEQHNISVGAFYIVTNGTIYSHKLMKALKYFYDNVMLEKELCGFEVSQDIYHDAVYYERENNLYKYQNLKDYYEYDFINLEGRKKIYSVILEGRAKENFTDGRKSEFKNGFYDEDSDYYCENQVYVAANGNVISNCDLSFETVDKNSFGNVNNETLRSIIDKFTKADDDIQAVVLQ